MDPITQGLLGGIVAQALANKNKSFSKQALFCGVVGGLAPDLDILIRSESDPLLSLEFHRHFTHSLAFIPIGGLLVSLFLYFLFFRKRKFIEIFFFSTAGFATHGLLDACTTYGTRLFWPFSDYRVSWDCMSIIDPIYTVTLLIFVIISAWKKSENIARTGFILSMLYICFGIYQHESATKIANSLALERNHTITHHQVMPTLANLFLWRSVYEHDGNFYFDSVYTSPFNDEKNTISGGSIKKLNVERDFPNLDDVQKQDIARFTHFANGFVAIHPDNKNIVIDMRYSSIPHGQSPLWGIEINPDAKNEHVKRVGFSSDRRARLEHSLEILKNRGKLDINR